MGDQFALLELDPLFSAAEDVQQSADRMDSAYRAWIHSNSTTHGTKPDQTVASVEVQRKELITAFETTKWQLEEFERAFTEANLKDHRSERPLARYIPFIEAISHQISLVQSNLRNSGNEQASHGLHVVSMGDGDRDDLANFLLGNQLTKSNAENGRIYPIEDYPTDERVNDHSHAVTSKEFLTCEYTVPLNMDVQPRPCPSREDEVQQSHMFGSREHGLKGKNSIIVLPRGLENPLNGDRLFCSADQSLLERNTKRTDFVRRNGSIGNGLLDWQDGSRATTNVDKGKELRKINNGYQSWNSWFLSVGHHLRGKLQHSKSGVKRYKDGDTDLMMYSRKETSAASIGNESASDMEKGESSNLTTSGRSWNGFSSVFTNILKQKQSDALRTKSEQKLLRSHAVRFVHTPSRYLLLLLLLTAVSVYFWFLSKSVLLVSGVVQGN
eukprot:Gb_35720 [translate_table: standard]